jgi:DNA-binding NarL/FixJ family response regulator
MRAQSRCRMNVARVLRVQTMKGGPFRGRGPPEREGLVKTVLLVDDSEDVRDVLRLFATADGRLRVVGEAENGREAVEAAERLQPDAIILDMSMPVMTGMEALPLLRARAPHSVVVVYAGGAREGTEPAVLAAGAVSYFDKRVSAKAVISGTVELLDRAAPAS